MTTYIGSFFDTPKGLTHLRQPLKLYSTALRKSLAAVSGESYFPFM